MIEKFPNANTLEVTRGVEEALDKLRPGLAGIQMDTSIARPATYIDESIDNLTLAAVIGAILLVAALGALLFEWRAALIAAFAIPISLMAGVLVLDVRGEAINLMVVAGFAIAARRSHRRRRQLDGRDRGPASRGPCGRPFHVAGGGNPRGDGRLEERRRLRDPDRAPPAPAVPVLGGCRAGGVPAARALVRPCGPRLRARRADGDAGPRLPALPARRAPAASRRSSAGSRRHTARSWSALLARPAAVIGTSAAVARARAGGRRRRSTSRSCRRSATPTSSSAGTPPPARRSRRWRASPTRVTSDLRAIPGVANVGAHVGRAVLGDQVVDVNSAELWVTIDPSADYSSTVLAGAGHRRRLPRASPRA